MYGTGYNYGGDGEGGERDRAGKLYGLFVLWRHEELLRWRGEHAPESSFPLPCVDKHRASLIRMQTLTVLP